MRTASKGVKTTIRTIVKYFRSGSAPAFFNDYGLIEIRDLRNDLEDPEDFMAALDALWASGRLGIYHDATHMGDRRKVRLQK